jgi:L,D-transpeptidase catalytic domain
MSVARLSPILVALVLAGCGSHSQQRTAPVRSGTAASANGHTPARPAVVRVPAGSGALAVMATAHGLTLRADPGGKVIAHLRPHTAWGSPTVVWAPERRGDWLGVVATSLPNNRIGWVNLRHDRPRMWRSRYSLAADLSTRTLALRRDGKVVRRMSIAIGAPSTPTPTGRFTLTDKLIPDRSLSYYGCCVLALSGHQPYLRPGWAGGDRIAIHGGGGVGSAASAGCLHLEDADLRHLMRILPLGTPVVIHA